MSPCPTPLGTVVLYNANKPWGREGGSQLVARHATNQIFGNIAAAYRGRGEKKISLTGMILKNKMPGWRRKNKNYPTVLHTFGRGGGRIASEGGDIKNIVLITVTPE